MIQEQQNIQNKLILYIHGQEGSPEEAEYYRPFFPEWDVYGFDYQSENPWDAKEEFSMKLKELTGSYSRIILVAGSIGAYFSINEDIGDSIEKAFFISPIVNMEKLIMDMITWAGTSESELEKQKIIPVEFGDDLSWDYLQYVRNHPIRWNVPTEILYGSSDHLQSLNTIQDFVKKTGAGLTVMEGGEHWFHTEEQMQFLDQWMQAHCSSKIR